ncbi:MAG: tRNA (adenosine(37)-N6)-dimethylallyltransferase MiaA [Patescibacteria group bacterium]
MDEQAVLKANGLVEAFLKTARRPLVVLLGPTASGKTQLSLDLASLFDGEIISADSRQVYRQMDIGTDKVPLEKRKIVPHHMIDIVDPDERFTTADYKQMTEKTIDEVLAKKRIPFLVGGTGLYLRTITQNFSLAGESQNLEIRKKLEEELNALGGKVLHDRLRELDPAAADKVHPNNRHHLLRALEIVMLTGKPKSAAAGTSESKYDVLKIGLSVPRDELYRRINERVDEQIKNGLVEETKKLLEKYPATLQSMQTLGYSEIVQYLNGELTLEQAIAFIKQNTRHFAKRQTTWFRKEADVHWLKLA